MRLAAQAVLLVMALTATVPAHSAPITDPNDARSWQGANLETFRALLGYATLQDLVNANILDDAVFPHTATYASTFSLPGAPCGSHPANILPVSYIGGVQGCSGYSYNPLTWDYTCGAASLADYSARGNCLDMWWIQDTGDGDLTSGNVWDLGGPSNQVAVFPIIDHGPMPGEAIEYSVYLSNNPNATQAGTDGNVDWVFASLDKVYLEGWHSGWIADGYTTVWRLPGGQTFRYANVVSGGPGALIRDDDDEIDTVIGLTTGGDPVGSNCPRSAGFWGQQCAQKGNGSTKYTADEVSDIAACADDLSSYFDWPSDTDFAGLCAAIDPPSPMGVVKQTKRQFAALLANVCAGQLGLIASNGERVSLSLSTPISCAGTSATTVGGLIAEVDAALAAASAGASGAIAIDGPVSGGEGDDDVIHLPGGTVVSASSALGPLVSCLDDINNGIGIGEVCADNQDASFVAAGMRTSGTMTREAAGPAMEFSRPTPNPFVDQTRFAYTLPRAAQVELGVYDLAGRLVRSLASEFQPAGRFEAVWDGRSADGARVKPGVYFVRGMVDTVPIAWRLLTLR